MAAAVRCFFSALLISFLFLQSQATLFNASDSYEEALQQQQEEEEEEVSAGHVLVLDCSMFYDANLRVNWSRGDNENLDEDSLPAGMRIIHHSLWFLPAHTAHSGNYSCVISSATGHATKHVYSVSVVNRTCPKVNPQKRPEYLTIGSPQITCDARRVYPLDDNYTVTWMKDCSTISPHKYEDRRLTFQTVSAADAGIYTCFMHFTYEGKTYTMSETMRAIVIPPGPVLKNPRVVTPQQETLSVKVGSRVHLNCKAFTGTDQLDPLEETQLYWLVNGTHPDFYPEFSALLKEDSKPRCSLEESTVYCQRSLSISEVRPEFLDINFKCVVLNSAGSDTGSVTLVPDSESVLYTGLAVVLCYTLVLVCVVLVYVFKVELVLAYRSLTPCLQTRGDGKLYDAYVSYLHSKSSAAAVALHVLPAVLEEKYGYRLFIRDRDETPGAAVHDVVSETLSKSRRLIVILSAKDFIPATNPVAAGLLQPWSSAKTGWGLGRSAPNGEAGWECYEGWLGLYEALVKESLQVIVVQVDGRVDGALLPESLRYILQSRRVLHYEPHYASAPGARFWRRLRYHMPPKHKSKLSAADAV